MVGRLLINEIASNPNPDWVEFFNPGPDPVDLGGWFFTDSETGEGHVYTFPAGTVVLAGGRIVREQSVDFPFGLGAADSVILHDPNGQIADQHRWTAHASSHGRCPDGSGAFVAMTPSKGAANSCP